MTFDRSSGERWLDSHPTPPPPPAGLSEAFTPNPTDGLASSFIRKSRRQVCEPRCRLHLCTAVLPSQLLFQRGRVLDHAAPASASIPVPSHRLIPVPSHRLQGLAASFTASPPVLCEMTPLLQAPFLLNMHESLTS